MRSIAQSLLARHPVMASVGVGCRWVCWLIAGHPFGLLVLALAIVVGLPWWSRAVVWVGAEAALGLWGFAGLTAGAQSINLWAHTCRFRRRWQGAFARAYRSPPWPPAVVENLYSVPGGLRPAFATPRLSVMPRAFDHRTIGWRLLPLADHDLSEMAAAVGRVGGSDEQVVSISLRSLPGGELALIVRFRSPGIDRSSRLASTGLGSLVIDETGNSAVDLWDDPILRPCSSIIDSGVGSSSDGGYGGAGATLGDVVEEAPDGDADERRLVTGTASDQSAGPLGWADKADGSRRSDVGADRSASNPPLGSAGVAARAGFPMKWGISVILPSNIVLAVAVATSDAGRVGVVAACAIAVVSLILIIAEGVADR